MSYAESSAKEQHMSEDVSVKVGGLNVGKTTPLVS